MLGLLLLIALLLPFRLWRATNEGAIWLDETVSLTLANHTFARIADLRAAERHPPLYFFALKAWIAVGKRLGVAPVLLWGRCLNIAAWVVLCAICWFYGRRMLGETGGAIFAWSVAISSIAGRAAVDNRMYMFALIGVTGCFIVIARLMSKRVECRAGIWRVLFAALAFALCALTAIWSHMLSAVAIGLLVLVAIAVATFVAESRRAVIVALTVGVFLSVIGFLPWLLRISSNLSKIVSLGEWLTPATLRNLFLVFAFWYPYGPINFIGGTTQWLMAVVGTLTFALPVAACLLAMKKRRLPDAASERLWMVIAMIGIGVTIANVVLLWTLQRCGFARSFHGPRYTVLTIAPWLAGIAACCVLAVRRARQPRIAAWLLISPWLICSIVGNALVQNQEAGGGLLQMQRDFPKLFPPAGSRLYVMPSELIPYHHQALARYDTHRIEDLPSVSRETTQVAILNLNFWGDNDRNRDQIVRFLAEQGTLSAKVKLVKLPPDTMEYKMLYLNGYKHDAAASLFRYGIAAAPAPFPGTAVSRAAHEDQFIGDGWSHLTVEFPNNELHTSRWGMAKESRIRFDAAVESGSHRVRVVGFRNAYPRPTAGMDFQFEGESGVLHVDQSAGTSDFVIEFPFEFKSSHQKPVLIVRHPTWRPCDYMKSEDQRTLTFQFRYAWVE